MPWNFPLWQVMRFAAPALMAGNVGLLKHASNVPQTALYLEELFRRAGFPEGAFQTLLIGSDAVERILRDPRVRAATLTGSEAAGRSVAAIAGRRAEEDGAGAGRQRPVRRDAVGRPGPGRRRWPPPPAARTTASPASPRSGSSCTPTSTTRSPSTFVAHMAALRGRRPDGRRHRRRPAGHRAGPRRRRGAGRTTRWRKGATVLCGGEQPDRPGWFYPPTVVADLTPADADVRRGGLRPGRRAVPGVVLRRGDRAGQRHAVRPRLERLDHRPGRAGAVRHATWTPARSSSTA